MVSVNRNGEVWTFAEQEDGRLHEVALELLSKGRELADRLKVPLAACLLGYNLEGLPEELVRYGADKVYVADHKLLARYQTNPYAATIVQMVTKYEPQIVICGATPLGRDLAPRVASALRCGLTADCTDLEIGEHTEAATKESHDDLLLQIRPAFGGNIIATIVNFDRWPQMATVREGVMVMPEAAPGRTGEMIAFAPKLAGADCPIEILDRQRAVKKVDLKKARVIVAGGAGVGSKENFRLVWDLANALGAAVGASRAAVDNGWIDKDHQVGQTGTTVRPALYIACGISGAVQHRAGMAEAAKILAINDDCNAPIFQLAHYGICGDMNDVIPRLIHAIKAKQ